jgi:DNA-binding NarL/FixJ family response regulator
MIRILLIDNHRMFTEARTRILENETDLIVLGEAPDGDTAIALLRAQPFDVAIMEIDLPGQSGLHWLKVIKAAYPTLPVLVLTAYPEEEYAIRCLRANAAGYLTKRHRLEELLSAIRRLAAGHSYITPATTTAIASAIIRQPGVKSLNDREIEILRLYAANYNTSQIAVQIGRTPHSVGGFRKRILGKLGATTTADLIRIAHAEGIVLQKTTASHPTNAISYQDA